MGCDIHIVLERRKIDSRDWVGVYTTDTHPKHRIQIAQRDYDFFAEVAGVRGRTDTTMHPRNLPEDVSDLAWQEYMRSPLDYHSPSHMGVDEFCKAYLKANPDAARPEFAAYDLLGADTDDRFEHRVVFWFDN